MNEIKLEDKIFESADNNDIDKIKELLLLCKDINNIKKNGT
jgi:hypothetical protein